MICAAEPNKAMKLGLLKKRFGGFFLEDVLLRYAKTAGTSLIYTPLQDGTEAWTTYGLAAMEVMARRKLKKPIREQEDNAIDFLYQHSYQHERNHHRNRTKA